MAGGDANAVIGDITQIECVRLSLSDMAEACASETAIRPMTQADAVAMADALRAVWRIMSRHEPAPPVTGATGTDG
jgi:hypothetical protein